MDPVIVESFENIFGDFFRREEILYIVKQNNI